MVTNMFGLIVSIAICLFFPTISSLPTWSSEECQPDRLTVYKVVLQTFWGREKFPKHYPEWRPPAQWSKIVGRSHDRSFVLFRQGHVASAGAKVLAESGRSDVLDAQAQGEGGVYDEFNAPAISKGSGRTEAEFFVDGNHSRVSLMARMVPSPDWFIGLDSFDLCSHGKWIDSATIDVDPMDAGTDKGLTFTSPKWANEPAEPIAPITNRYPSHPAASFRYPDIDKLPVIASFDFRKVKEYELSEVFHHSEINDVIRKVSGRLLTNDINDGDTTQDRSSNSITDSNSVHQIRHSSSIHQHQSIVESDRIIPSRVTHNNDDELVLLNEVELGEGKKNHHKDFTEKKNKKKNKGKNKKANKIRPPRDCRISEWSAWGPCSVTCGIGETQRSREVISHARRGGRPCPALTDRKWCGSARACHKEYFNW